jgi:pantetheine-phosphate adenylyltransferase
MNKVAIYPGTFDPITYGHIDVIKKALKLFDRIIVGVSNVSNKKYLFDSDERIEIVNKALFKDLKLKKKKNFSCFI